jgi:hypothetical protein
LFKEKRLNSDPGLYSRYFDPVYNIIYAVNKHKQEQRTYYDHRHSGIDKTNILQEVIAVEGETLMMPVILLGI